MLGCEHRMRQRSWSAGCGLLMATVQQPAAVGFNLAIHHCPFHVQRCQRFALSTG
jgi:hypothetical protein